MVKPSKITGDNLSVNTATFNDVVTVNGITTWVDNVNSDTVFNGTVTFNSSTTINGVATFNSTTTLQGPTIFAEDITVNTASTFNNSQTYNDNFSVNGKWNWGTEVVHTITSDAITLQGGSFIGLEGEGASDDTLTTINGGSLGDIIMLIAHTETADARVVSTVGNISLNAAERRLNKREDRLWLIYNGAKWCLVGFNNNI